MASLRAVVLLAAIAGAAAVVVSATFQAGPTAQANMATTQAFLQNFETGARTPMCGTFLAANSSVQVRGDPALLPIAGQWAGAAGCLGYQRFSAAAARYTSFDWSPAASQVDVLVATSAQTFAVGHTSVKVPASGQSVANVSAAMQFMFDNHGNISTIDMVYDTSALAQAFCKSGALVCPASTPARQLETETADPSSLLRVAVTMAPKAARELSFRSGSTQASNFQMLQAYWNAFFHGNMSGAASCLDPSVVTTLHGQQSIMPIAGTWYGRSGWVSFLTGFGAHVSNYTLSDFGYQGCTGSYCVVSWKEHSFTNVAGRPIDGLLNLAVYTFSSVTSLITRLDVYVDSLAYAVRFCPTTLTCK